MEKDKDTEKKIRKKKLKRATDTAIASVVSAGILLGGVFHAPAGRDDDGMPDLASPPAIVEMVYPDLDDGDDGNPEETDEERRKKNGFAVRFASFTSRIPKMAIPFIGAFMWVGCWFGLTGLLGTWIAALPVWLGALIRAAICTVITAAVLFIMAKLAFPWLKAGKIFSRGRLAGALAGMLLIVCTIVFMERADVPVMTIKIAGAAEGAVLVLLELLSLRISCRKEEQ